MEEAGAEVDVKELLHIREYIGKNHEHASFDSGVHQVEYYFLCELLTKEDDFIAPMSPDSHQTGIEWVSPRDLDRLRIYPRAIVEPLLLLLEGKKAPVYLGDVN